jgi:subtilisin-like proprotein convertase family protein
MKKSTLLLMVFCLFAFQLSAQTKNQEKEKEAARLALEPSNISLEKLIQQKSDSYVIIKEHVSSISGIHHIYLRQAINGLEVYGTESSVHIDKTGKVLLEHNNFLMDVLASVKSSSQGISARQAVTSVAGQMGYGMANLEEIKSIGGKNKATVFNKANISSEDIPVKLMYYYREGIGTYLVWELSVAERTSSDWWNFRVDAATGKIIDKDNWTVSCNILGNHEDHVHLNKDKAPFIGPMEEPITSTTSNSAPPPAASYRVYAMPIESPNYGTRTLVTNSENLTASPFGWHDIDGVDGAEFTNSRGNNTDTYDDDNANNNPDGKYAFSPGGNLIFDFPLNTTYSAGDQSENAAITNLFYWTNIIHDVVYQYGFDEASGNFQHNNYGNGGLGNDPVNAEAQDGSGTCNANFGTPADGNRPRMQMYVCNSRDGDLDNLVIVHEYAHGISNRLSNLGGQEQMGEGWSDYYGLMLTMQTGDAGPDARGIGTWLFGEGPGGPGIRPWPYSTDFGVNPHTYDDIKTEVAPHGVGSVWAEMLWEMTWELIAIYGFDTDFYNGTGGNNIAMALVTEGLKLQPSLPGFVDGRDAILAADMAMYGGANQCVIWDAFARRGLGYSAIQGSSASKTDGTEAFDLPPNFSSLNVMDEVCLSDGIQTGLSGGNPTGGVYSGPGVTDDGNGTTFTFDPSIGGPGSVTVSYLVNDFCTGAPTTLTDDINVTNDPPEIICMGTGNIPMTDSSITSPGTPITSNTTITSTLTVADNVSITDLNVDLNINHTWVGDLVITLESPAGTTITILDPGSCSGDDVIILLDDEAPTTSSACYGTGSNQAYPDPSYQPFSQLSIFDGENTAGDWILSVSDTASGDEGTLNSWGINYDYEVTAPVLDVTLDGTGNATINAEDLLYSASVECGGYTVLAGSPLAATVSFTCSDTGLNTVLVEVTNDSGATSTCSAIVNVIGGGGGGGPFVCPGDITQSNDPGSCDAVVMYTVESPSGCGGSAPLATGTPTLELISSAGGTSNRSGVSYNPSADRYYSVNAGSGGYPIDCFDGTSGALVSNIASGLSYRGAWWNPSLSQSEGNGISPNGVVLTNLSGDCPSGTTTLILPSNQPNSQSCGDLDYDNNEIIYYNAGSITQVDRATGTTNATLVLSGTPVGTAYASTSVGYTGEVGYEYAVYDTTTQSVHLYDRATGAYAASSSIGLATSAFGFAYENEQAWIYANDRWNGFTIFGTPSGTITQTAGLPSGATFPVGTITNTFEYDDGINPVQTCSFDVTVNDTEAPVIACVADATVDTNTGCTYVAGTEFDATFTDNCMNPAASITNDYNASATLAGEALPLGTNTIVWTANDGNGQTAQCTTIITVEDNEVPVITCAANATVDTNTGCTYVAGTEFDATFTDNCMNPAASVTNDYNASATLAGEALPLGVHTVVWTANDGNGQSAQCTTIITVEDNAPPVMNCPADFTVSTDTGVCGATVSFADPIAVDNCGVASVTQTAGLPSGSVFPIGPNVVAYTAIDIHNNTTTCSFTITVIDDDAPTAVCMDITIPLDAAGNATILPADVDGGSTDNCAVASLSIDIDTFTCADVGTNNVVLTVTDTNGNMSSCTAIVTVEDVTAPTAVCQNITVALDATGTVTIDPAMLDGGATDGCGGALTYSVNIDTFDCSNIGDNTVTLTVFDPSGNTATCTATVTVEDNIGPDLVCTDLTVSLDENGLASILPNDVVASITDACGIDTLDVDIENFSCDDIGTPVTVNVVATDMNGNSVTCSATVTVVDMLAPLLDCPLDETVTVANGEQYQLPDYFATGLATATDNCTDPVTLTSQTPAAATMLDPGVYTISFTAADAFGNESSCEMELTVEELLGTEENSFNLASLTLYPNPANNYVILSNPNNIPLRAVSIYDITGRLIQKMDGSETVSEMRIDISELASATYMVLINTDAGLVTKQLVKE